MQKKKIPWHSITANDLYDSDGCHPSPDEMPRLMREFRDMGCISGYWFVDSTAVPADPANCLFVDAWNAGELRPSDECGPDPKNIDFEGLGDEDQDDATN